jgi:hypothetical protein
VFQLSEVGTASHVPDAACEALVTNANPMIAAVKLRGVMDYGGVIVPN